MNPWHDVESGEDVPEEVNVIIEVPKNSTLKYELDKRTGLIKLDRVLYSAVHYPGDYGFIPRTYWEDKDPLDIIVLSNFPVYPLTIVRARPIGVIRLKDNNENDDKIVAVHARDPRFDRYRDITDVPEHVMAEIKHFFETYKQLQNKHVTVLSIENGAVARKIVMQGITLYKKNFNRKNKKR
ncbi:MAG: inorganic pyrophosphatase [Candidatus Woesearchaeota archaeon]|nr:MAG: inorganic pyrophosphatase [Candidatus Woesearchaeota archaeon]